VACKKKGFDGCRDERDMRGHTIGLFDIIHGSSDLDVEESE